MRKLIVLFAVAVATIAPAQAAAHHTPSHTQRQLNQTRGQLNSLRAFVHDCLGWRVVGIGAYGDPPSQGFEYSFEGDTQITTALDIVPGTEAPTFYVAEIRPRCVRQVGRRAFSAATLRSASLARKALRFG